MNAAVRSRSIAARVWWWTLPFAGWVTYDGEVGATPPPWYAYPLARLNRLAARAPGFRAFEPSPPVECDCAWCRGVPGARFEP